MSDGTIKYVGWQGVLLPKRETSMWHWIVPRMLEYPEERIKGYPSYQRNKYNLCLPYIKDFSHALDIGAHCGFWTMAMSQDFKKVTAFEPSEENCVAFVHNVDLVAGNCEVNLIQMALGDKERFASVKVSEDSSTDAFLVEGSEIIIQPLDALDLAPPTFVKIDVDGYELPVVQGALGTLREFKPPLIVEVKSGFGEARGHENKDIFELLQSIGYQVKEEMKGDYLMVCE